MSVNVTRKQAAFSVMPEQCKTCIYTANSITNIPISQLEDEIRDPHHKGLFTSYRQCHMSDSACCRGFWDRHKNHFALGQIAQRLGYVK